MNHSCSDSRCRHGFVRAAFLLLVFLVFLSIPAVLAQGREDTGASQQQPRIDDRTHGEEDQINRRREWFYESRRDGVTSDADLWSLRLDAVEQTRQALEQQRMRKSLGFEGQQNFWVAKGPAPSRFGSWSFGSVSGRIQAIAADWAGGILYVGAGSGGVWKSTNDGLSWTNIFETAGTMAVGAITVDPNDSSVLWVGTGDNISGCESYFGIGLLRSPDGGQTWEPRNGSGNATLQELASFANVIVDPRDSDHLVVGGRNRGCASGNEQLGGLFTSNNGGQTWTNRIADEAVYEIAQDPLVPDTFWAATSVGIYKSEDNGQSWLIQTGGLPTSGGGRAELAVSPSDSNTIYVLFSQNPTFWRSTDGGGNWEMMSSGSNACDGQCFYNMALRVHPTDPDTVYRGTVHIFKTANGGTSWSDLSNNWGSSQKVHQDMHALLLHPTDPDAFYVSGDGGIWKSEDGGSSFSNLNGNLNITQFYAIGVDANDPERICGGAQDNSSLARSDSNVWDRQAVTGDGFVCQIDPQSSSYSYITSYPSGGYPNVWRSSNGLFGSHIDITGSGSGINQNDRIAWVTPYTLDPTQPNILYLGTHRVYRSDNRGSSWAQVGPTDLTGGSSSLRTLEVNRNFPSTVFSGSSSGRVWRTVNGGTDWTDITTGLPSRTINDIAADPTSPDRAFAVVGGFNTAHVWEWNAVGGWTARDGGLPNVPVNAVLMLTDSDLLVGTDTGIFRSFDGGEHFVPYMDGLPEGLVVTDLKFNTLQSIITAGTYGRGVWQVTVGTVQPILLVDSFEQPFLEVDGDGDTNVEPGETWSVVPVLRNVGGEIAIDVTARLATATPGVTVLDEIGDFGELGSGATAAATAAQRFTVDPSFVCGEEIVFDVVDIASTNAPDHSDAMAALRVSVLDFNDTPIVTALVDENFDAGSPEGWAHTASDPDLAECPTFVHPDQWGIATRDAAHGPSFHCGTGSGGTYSRGNFSWLFPTGRDSIGGPGILIPNDATAATVTVVHWYDTVEGEDGGQVAIDATLDGEDVYTTLEPVGDYPGEPLETGQCNGLGGRQAFQGSSGGWVTSEFDLMDYRGDVVYLAFIFGADKRIAAGEGWYIDEVRVEFLRDGPPVCHVIQWPGEVAEARFDLLDPTTIEASWDDSCNIDALPVQTYSIQVGDLDLLATGGTYSHAALADRCDHTSASTFSPGAGNEYYLVVPAADGREGSAGADSSGADRPQGSLTCGERRVSCP